MTNNKIRSIIIAIIVFIIFSIIVFALPFDINATFWVSYIFVAVSIVVSLYVINNALLKDPDAKSKFYGFPLTRLCLIYFIIQTALSLVFDCFSKHIPAWIPTCICFVILGLVVIGLITMDAVKEEVQRQETEVRVNTSIMQDLRLKVYSLPDRSEDASVKKDLKKLAEDFKYSDPVSSDMLSGIEADLAKQVEELCVAVNGKDDESVKMMCSKVGATLEERNRMCRLNKGKK